VVFWVGKYEVTQRQWKRVVGEFPGKLTAGEGDDFPVYDINFAEAEGFCRKLQGTPGRVLGRRGLALPVGLSPGVRARA
jgi:formylglycine-generating enzyme required for sulfatase activity